MDFSEPLRTDVSRGHTETLGEKGAKPITNGCFRHIPMMGDHRLGLRVHESPIVLSEHRPLGEEKLLRHAAEWVCSLAMHLCLV